MLKVLFVIIIIIWALLEFWFMHDINKKVHAKRTNIKIEKLPPLLDKNSSSIIFFNDKIWELTEADIAEHIKPKPPKTKEIAQPHKKPVVEIITKKGTKHLCKGKRCFTIKAIMENTLLLVDDKHKVISLKPSDIIFDVVRLVKLTDTQLWFENNKTKEKYHLKFFSYNTHKDKNATK